ncbi:polyketide cyclase [Leucobacter coleopterorum]|uniref:Polyketide cyclase n=1 Tax=Leucobacter coleopterorum TaxID=2714933 RepID=A0ABX6JTB3_9MICO|nr:SRPBCC family protein [Leucobacter coleopterorum]QIM17530.1 polyketide cyclase [Leucobacter coleopterorum]
MTEELRIVSAERVVVASPEVIFELIADPAQQPRWDGNDNLSEAAPGQRVHQGGDVFVMKITTDGQYRENRVVEFEEDRRIAWLPSPVGAVAPGHLWRWELEPQADGTTLVRHTYDWTALHDEKRMVRARATTADSLLASIDRLAALAESVV